MAAKGTLYFPPGFLWGCATAAHQVEGHNVNDWWRWEQTPGRIFQDQRSGAACDWWAGRYAEDFDRAAEMHNNAQRISIEWSRVEPEPGKWDQDALDHYREMIIGLRERGMKPMVTLHHFTNPLWVGDHDGWLWDEVPERFEQFTRKVITALGDVCDLWCTLNEPNVYATNGYIFGTWTPGLKSVKKAARALYNQLRGHTRAYHAIKELQPQSQVGLAIHLVGNKPLPPKWINQAATRFMSHFFNRSFLDAFTTGRLRLTGGGRYRFPKAKGALDWIGMQYYQEFRSGFTLRSPGTLFVAQSKPTDMPVGPHTWGGLNPTATFDMLMWLWRALGKPIYITESGVPDPDDTIRPGYLAESLKAAWRATTLSIPLKGFFHWSLVDNFEWAEGYDPRYSFGLYQVNFQTQSRTARPSARFYGEVCAQNGLSAETVERFAPDVLEKVFPGEAGKAQVTLKARATGTYSRVP